MTGSGSSDRGVVTACDRNYFPGLLWLRESIQTSFPCPVVVYDLGLTDAQLERAAGFPDLRVLELPRDPDLREVIHAFSREPALPKPDKRVWPLWICPLLIRSAPLREVFWLDCDLVVLRGLGELFRMLDEGPVFTCETYPPEITANRPELYRRLPIQRTFDPAAQAANGGVSGWRRGRDDRALDAYARPVFAAARDPFLRQAVTCHDQGALNWAIQSEGLEHRVLADPAWNLPVGMAALPPGAVSWDAQLTERLRQALPEVKLLHWNGRLNPWAA